MTDSEIEGRTKALLADASGRASERLLDRARPIDDVCGDLMSADAALGEGPGTTIGRYKLLQSIGEGGFGTVWMAEQLEPVRRKVALKIVKLGMDSRQVVARFEAERQALALMDHPNIAKVLDGGVTETGRPFFVMELVRGVPITEYCDAARCSARARLALFVDVCNAVQHAHQKGIIHRDIKPSNVMVTLHDGRPVPMVIDFGIAKATSGSLTTRTLFTEFRQFLGTPQYMSPEQAEMSGLDIDTRADIYSLGVLLYELLTGTTPTDPAALRTAAYDELLHLIRDVDPPRPSTRFSTLGEQRIAIARARSTDPHLLERVVRGDLDWIVMRALEKERTRRYESAASFAQDVQRYLANEPIEARPPSRVYRMRKFVRRNRVVVAAGALVTTALLVGTAVATVGFVRAERGRVRAAEEAASAADVNAFYDEMLFSIDPLRLRRRGAFAPEGTADFGTAPGLDRDVSVVEMLLGAASTVDAKFERKPELAAKVRETIGVTLLGLSEVERAEEQLALAAALLEAATESPASVGASGANEGDRMRVDLLRATAALRAGELERAEARATSALDGMRRLHGLDSSSALHAATVLGEILAEAGEFERSEALLRETLDRQRRALGSENRDTIDTLNQLAHLFLWQTRPLDAEPIAEEAYERSASVLDPNDVVRVNSEHVYGVTLALEMEYARAEPILRSALAKERRILGDGHQTIANTAHQLARCLQDPSQIDEREALLREAVAIVEVRGAAAANAELMRRDLAMALFAKGRADEAVALANRSLELARGAEPVDERAVSNAKHFVRLALMRAGRSDEARSLALDHMDALSENVDEASYLWTCSSLADLSIFLRDCGLLDEARVAWRGCLDIRGKMADRPGSTGEDLARLGGMLLRPWVPGMEDVEAAAARLSAALEVGFAPESGWEARALRDLEEALASLGREDEFEAIVAKRLAAYERLFARGTGTPTAMRAYGTLLVETSVVARRDPRRAVEALRLALAAEDVTHETWYEFARACWLAGDEAGLREAVVALARATVPTPTSPTTFELNEHVWALALHPFEDLREHDALRRSVEALASRTPLASGDANVLNTIGVGWWRLGEFERAREALEEADRRNTGYSRALDLIPLAGCSFALGDAERGEEELRTAREALADPSLGPGLRAECEMLLAGVLEGRDRAPAVTTGSPPAAAPAIDGR